MSFSIRFGPNGQSVPKSSKWWSSRRGAPIAPLTLCANGPRVRGSGAAHRRTRATGESGGDQRHLRVLNPHVDAICVCSADLVSREVVERLVQCS